MFFTFGTIMFFIQLCINTTLYFPRDNLIPKSFKCTNKILYFRISTYHVRIFFLIFHTSYLFRKSYYSKEKFSSCFFNHCKKKLRWKQTSYEKRILQSNIFVCLNYCKDDTMKNSIGNNDPNCNNLSLLFKLLKNVTL